MSVNKVILLGNCTAKPEIRSFGNGNEVASFSLATSEKWVDKASGEKKEKPEFHNIVVFGGLVKVIKNYVDKGTKLYIEGALQTDKWTDDKGIERRATKVVLQGFSAKLELLGGKPKTEAKPPQDEFYAEKLNREVVEAEELDDSIPF